MARSLFVIGSRVMCGKSAIALGVTRMALNAGKRVAVFRPVVSDPDASGRDHDLNLLLTRFKLDIPYERTFVWGVVQAKALLLEDQAHFFDAIIERHKELEKAYDFVVCLGADLGAGDEAFERAMNFRLAAAMGAQAIFVVAPTSREEKSLVESVKLACHDFVESGISALAVIVNRVAPEQCDRLQQQLDDWVAERGDNELKPLIYVVPENERLSFPTMDAIRVYLGADLLYGEDHLNARIRDYVIGAMRVEAFLEHLSPAACVITPGDRADILLGTVAATLSPAYAKAAGMVLTGGKAPSPAIHRLFADWGGFPMTVLSTPEATYPVAKKMQEFRVRIEPNDEATIQTAFELFRTHVDEARLWAAVEAAAASRLTPEIFEYSLFEKARAAKARIVLPEGDEERILRAAEEIVRKKIAVVTLLGNPDALRTKIAALGLELADLVIEDPASSPKHEAYAQTLYELRKHKGLTLERAAELMRDRTYFGTMMVYKGEAAGMVSGSTTTTAETIRPALEFVKTKPGISIVSGIFFMCLRDRVLVYGDCAVNPDPSAEQLAQIAICSADTARKFGIEPRVAMLSYSTGASGKGEDVETVREATRLAKELAPELLLDGPLQYDAAVDPVVAAEKLPNSPVAGRATVFIFPDLDTGNNTYKAVQRSAGAVAMGPVLQGLNKPVNDLSRGCTIKDIVYTVAITAIQSAEG